MLSSSPRQGKRMRSALPKVLHPIAGKPLLAHVLEAARAVAGDSGTICVVYGHGGEVVPATMPCDDIAWVIQAPQLAPVTRCCRHCRISTRRSDPGLYGDVPLTRVETLTRLIAEADDASLALLTVCLDDAHGYDASSAPRTALSCASSKRRMPTRRSVPSLKSIPASGRATGRLAEWLPTLGKNKRPGRVLPHRHRCARRGRRPAGALGFIPPIPGSAGGQQQVAVGRPGTRLPGQPSGAVDGAGRTAGRSGSYRCARRTHLRPGRVHRHQLPVRRPRRTRRRVIIGANCVVKNCTVGEASFINAFSHIEDSVVGPNCRIGPYAACGPGTVLGQDVHIGNFVEVKNSSIADHSKANHLSYVGDSTVGTRVNIGAGTITCNYDGVNKHGR